MKLLTAAYKHHSGGLLNENEFNIVRTKFEGDTQKAQARLAKIEEQISRYDTDKARESECLVTFRRFRDLRRLIKL